MDQMKERIELHCHSKAGGNATMYPGEVIKYMSDRKMDAVAITDDSVVHEFPELEQVWRTGNYTARPIYGMEMRIADGDGFYFVTILVKNETGKRNLYHILSDNLSEEAHPIYEWTNLMESREGLLIGTGAIDGRLYRLLNEGAGEDRIREVIHDFDYVEVLPLAEYEDINRSVISVCNDLSIPVVAISDAHYLHREDRIAWSIMCSWNDCDESNAGGYILSTQEMLDAFSYLPEEEAYEVVVENTHRIAQMCETVEICPRKKFFPKYDGNSPRPISADDIKLRKKTFERIDRIEDEAARNVALSRRNSEVNALWETDMSKTVLLVQELLRRLELRPCDISLRGVAAGSYVLHLLDAAEADPLFYGMESDMIFGVDGDRHIVIDINMSEKKQAEAFEIMESLPGIKKAVRVGTIHFVSESLANAMIEQYEQDNEWYIESPMREQIRYKIVGNYKGRGKHPGSVFLIPDGCDHESIFPTFRAKGGCEITGFCWYDMDYTFVKMTCFNHRPTDMLHRLSEVTGMDIKDVPKDAEEVLELFSVDENGQVSACEDIPAFKSEDIREIIAELKPESFDDLVKVLSLAHGTGVWKENGEVLVREQGITLKELISNRDDVFEYLLSMGIDRRMAYKITEMVRKGIIARGRNAKWHTCKKILQEAGVPDWYIWSCERIHYLFPRAHSIAYLYTNMRLGWFKLHYPQEYKTVISEYEQNEIKG